MWECSASSRSNAKPTPTSSDGGQLLYLGKNVCLLAPGPAILLLSAGLALVRIFAPLLQNGLAPLCLLLSRQSGGTAHRYLASTGQPTKWQQHPINYEI